MRNLTDRWLAANPIARITTYVIVGLALGTALRVWF
jgi:hypothetical protein